MNNIITHKIKLGELKYIIFRNVFLLTNGIIFAVVVLLLVFGQTRAGLFLGIISLVNLGLGLAQDIHAWLALENLQLLTAPRVLRINLEGGQESVLTEQINKGDRIKLTLGDQIPCDSVLVDSQNLEINEGLITGESSSVPKSTNDRLQAGSIVTAGSGIIKTETVFYESRIARMTEGIKKHSLNLSPIQQSVNLVVKYSGFVLLAAIAYAIARGMATNEPIVGIVLNVGALASMLVPQGLVFAITLFFAYGAANLFQKHVLLQEVNATEKLGRIKNLCMDKTGTLTQNVLSVEDMHTAADVTQQKSRELVAGYLKGNGETSEIIRAVRESVKTDFKGEAIETLPFSSWRQFGAVRIKRDGKETVVLAGAPDVFLPHISNESQKQWLAELLGKTSAEGKRVVCFGQTTAQALSRDLSAADISPVALFVFHNNIREGISKTVEFFQNRGVRIRIISGDNPQTASSVAKASGINLSDQIITGPEMANWGQTDYDAKVKSYTIFARIVPEQKEKIIEAFKKDGFTAMVGDGANDALAIKKADLGIAMFDGAPATRQLSAIVLTDNSFEALPGGVELADDVIKNIEIFSSMFFCQTFAGLFLFIILSLLGQQYPLTPFNITLINYFTIGIPGLLISYWTIRPPQKILPVGSKPFLKRILPFAVWSAVLQTAGTVLIYAISPAYLKTVPPNTLVVLAFIAFGFTFFAVAPFVYQGLLNGIKKTQILILGITELFLLIIVFKIQLLTIFFNVPALHLSNPNIIETLLIIAVGCLLQYFLARRFASKTGN
jgi:cation-transporting ATPase E